MVLNGTIGAGASPPSFHRSAGGVLDGYNRSTGGSPPPSIGTASSLVACLPGDQPPGEAGTADHECFVPVGEMGLPCRA